MSRHRLTSCAALLAFAMAVAACGVGSPMVDGWPVGDATACPRPECATILEVAAAGFDRRDPGHAPVVDASVHAFGTVIGDDGRPVGMMFSGGTPFVVLFRLADGSRRAIGVKRPGIQPDPIALDWGPGLGWDPPPGHAAS